MESNSAAMDAKPPLDLTIVLTTSPTRSNPSIEMLQLVIDSFSFVENLGSYKMLFTFDGYKVKEAEKVTSNSYRNGVISDEMIPRYEQYIENVELWVKSDPRFNAELLVLEERHGFGFAVKRALEQVNTKYVMVVQHDRTFIKSFDILPLLQILDTPEEEVNYIGFITTSTLNHLERIRGRLGAKGPPPDLSWARPKEAHGVTLLPLLQWFDSTHVCTTAYYRDFVFGPGRRLVRKGGFIEDKLGQQQLADLKARGEEGFRPYGTYLMDHGPGEKTVSHLDGGDFHTEAQRRAKGWGAREGGGRRLTPPPPPPAAPTPRDEAIAQQMEGGEAGSNFSICDEEKNNGHTNDARRLSLLSKLII